MVHPLIIPGLFLAALLLYVVLARPAGGPRSGRDEFPSSTQSAYDDTQGD